MPKYRARVSVTLPYKQRYASISVSSEAEMEGDDLDAVRDEVQKFVLDDVERLLARAWDQEIETASDGKKQPGPRRVKR